MQMTAPSGTGGVSVAGIYFPVDEAGFITVESDFPAEAVGALIRAGFVSVADSETPAEAIVVDRIEADAAAVDALSFPAVEPEA